MNILKIAIFGLLSIGLASAAVAFLSRPIHASQAYSVSAESEPFLALVR
jgi:hypothetical protein